MFIFVILMKNLDFYGRLDECLANEKREYIPVDFKTASANPRRREIFPSYQNQMDGFVFLLEKNNKRPAGFAYLIYIFIRQKIKNFIMAFQWSFIFKK